MSQPNCFSVVNFCELLIARLDAAGEIDPGSTSLYVTESGIELGMNPVVETAQRFTQRNGCGNFCAVVDTDCDVVIAYTLSLQLCEWELELAEILQGGTSETTADGTGEVVIGYQDPDPTAACYNGVCVEAYAMAWDGDEQATHPVTDEPAYMRYRFPKVRWTPGQSTLVNGIAVWPVTGRAVPNSAAGLGPNCDWPAVVQGPRAYDLVSASDLPSAACGLQELVACGS